MPGYYDIHSHILPGIDDGPAALPQALELAAAYVADGAAGLVATPHYVMGMGIAEFLRRRQEALDSLMRGLREKGIDLSIKLGAEVSMIPKEKGSSSYREIEENAQSLCLGDTNLMLVEYPAGPEPVWFEESIYRLQKMNVQPVLAHAERYGWLKNKKRLAKLIDKGAYLQVNAGSLRGLFTPYRGFAKELLGSDYVHFVATDSHDARRRRPKMSCLSKGRIFWHLDNSKALFGHKGEHIFYVSL